MPNIKFEKQQQEKPKPSAVASGFIFTHVNFAFAYYTCTN